MKKQTFRKSFLDEICANNIFGNVDYVTPDSVVIHSQTFSPLEDPTGTHQLLVNSLFDLVEDLQQGASKEEMLKKVLQIAAHFQHNNVSLNDRLLNLCIEIFDEKDVILSE